VSNHRTLGPKTLQSILQQAAMLRSAVLVAMGLGLLPVLTALAHREDYIDETLVFQTLEEHTVEPEYWFDYGTRPEGDFTRHNVSLEYGITDHLMVDGRATIDNPDNNKANFDSARFEIRSRFAEEGDWPIDIALSAEVNTRRLENGHYQYGLEPRLVLSKDFAKLNFTLNVAEELPVNRGAPSVELASGVRYDATKLFRFGSELKYDVHERSAAVIPQVWLAFPRDITFKAGYSKGFDQNREDFVRFVIEIGL
jgi:hypothetical protein